MRIKLLYRVVSYNTGATDMVQLLNIGLCFNHPLRSDPKTDINDKKQENAQTSAKELIELVQ